MRQYRVLLFLLFVCFITQSVSAYADFEIAKIGKVGKKTHFCVNKNEKSKARLDRGSRTGRTVPLGKSIKLIKKAISNVTLQIKAAKKRALKRKKKAKRTALKAILARAKDCKKSELPLEVKSAAGTASLSIPLSAIPDGIDPATIAVSTAADLGGFTVSNTPVEIVDLQPDGLQLLEPIRIIFNLPEDVLQSSNYELTLLHIAPSQASAGQEHDAIGSTENLNPILDADTSLPIAIGGEITHFSKVGLQTSLSQAGERAATMELTAPLSAPTGSTFKVKAVITLNDGQVHRRWFFSNSEGERTEEDTVAEGYVWIFEGYGANRAFGASIHGNKVDGNRWGVQTGNQFGRRDFPTTMVYTDTFTLDEEFVCKYEGLILVTVSVPIAFAVERKTKDENGKLIDTRIVTETAYLKADVEVLCISDNDDDTDDGEKICKTTGAFSTQCPQPGGNNSVVFAAFVDPAKGIPTRYELVDEDGNVVKKICPESTEENIREVESLPPGASIPGEPGKTPFYVLADITGGDGSTSKVKLRVYCSKELEP